ncbi:L,D-transpeptidase family protein [Nocardioides zeae]|uniref:Peptidoglycan hydrolase-like protein with peptidoglycan-binding domain n=1 Tax=Nocardioides zeae TaxID=1457234 RepID=A0AAJ1U8W7_9ACTN|nr:L,D-transpeptidase family protein [Nocardioides zeae]MDQ1106541.1 peptidoglycan hydrolase-like protein with peptidoglycan-binding domain [Nocardioides zeae]
MRILRGVLVTLLALGVTSGLAVAVGYAGVTYRAEAEHRAATAPSPEATPSTTPPTTPPTTPAPAPEPEPQPEPEPEPEPELVPGPALYAAGDSGDEVRDLQARLVQIDWLPSVTGEYDAATVAAVEGFQAKRGFPVTGEVDERTLDRVHAMTGPPTYEEMHDIVPVTGALDARCRTGRVLCVDKSTRTLRWVVDGQVLQTFDVRFGREGMETREGAFRVERKSRDHVSSIYDTSMPFAMFFSGGQAVHYSPDFAANGYDGASHGCVNVRDREGIAALFDQVRVGDGVVVYWS